MMRNRALANVNAILDKSHSTGLFLGMKTLCELFGNSDLDHFQTINKPTARDLEAIGRDFERIGGDLRKIFAKVAANRQLMDEVDVDDEAKR